MPAARYLLDTSVFAQPIRKQPAPAVMEHWVRVGDAVCAVSVVSIAEVEWGLHKAAIPRWWNLYEQLLKSRLPILPTDRSVWTGFSRLKAAQLGAGRNPGDFDLLIAATALANDLTVATLNLRHFAPIDGLRVEDWSA